MRYAKNWQECQHCNGFRGDFVSIAQGILDLMVEAADKEQDAEAQAYLGAMCLGMLPAPAMKVAAEGFRETCARSALQYYEVKETPENLAQFAKHVPKDMVSEFCHKLSSAMLKEWKRRGFLLV